MATKLPTLYDDYDNLIIRCIPNYHKILQIVVEDINDDKNEILDIGIGTGNLEEFIFQKFPKAKITGIDTSANFLNKAKLKFDNLQLQTIQGDIRSYKIEKNKFSKILASLAIHHFEDQEKKDLFQKIYQALPINGIFINFDMVKPKTEEQLSKLQEELFLQWKNEGLTNDFIEIEKIEMKERDRLTRLSIQKEWLEKIGFTFTILYENGLFCIYKCIKI